MIIVMNIVCRQNVQHDQGVVARHRRREDKHRKAWEDVARQHQRLDLAVAEEFIESTQGRSRKCLVGEYMVNQVYIS